jgi:ELWxxDGT repeat protein
MVRDINPGGASSNSHPTWLEAFGGRLLFTANDDERGGELWKSEGTRAGTVMVKDLTPVGRRRSRIGAIVRIEDKLALFSAFGEGSLHKTDGTAKGTKVVRRPRDGGPGYVAGITRVQGLGALLRGYSALWKSDGTRAGTVQILGLAPAEITALGEQRALFVADDGVHGSELWFTDGTTGGTHLVEDINP